MHLNLTKPVNIDNRMPGQVKDKRKEYQCSDLDKSCVCEAGPFPPFN